MEYNISSVLLTNRIRKDYQVLVVNHTIYACSGNKDVDGMVWKQCFYRQIEEYRKSIRKTTQIIDQESREVDTTTPAVVNPISEKARLHLAKLHTAFAKLLSDATSFYQDCMLKVIRKPIDIITLFSHKSILSTAQFLF